MLNAKRSPFKNIDVRKYGPALSFRAMFVRKTIINEGSQFGKIFYLMLGNKSIFGYEILDCVKTFIELK